MQRFVLLILLSIFSYTGFAQKSTADSLLINSLVKNIAAMQVTADGEFYKGMFPSFRECGGAETSAAVFALA